MVVGGFRLFHVLVTMSLLNVVHRNYGVKNGGRLNRKVTGWRWVAEEEKGSLVLWSGDRGCTNTG